MEDKTDFNVTLDDVEQNLIPFLCLDDDLGM